MTPALAWKRIGHDLVSTVQQAYQKYKENPNAANRKRYMVWRLRIHLKCNERYVKELTIVDDEYNLGLFDSDAGPLLWDIERG